MPSADAGLLAAARGGAAFAGVADDDDADSAGLGVGGVLPPAAIPDCTIERDLFVAVTERRAYRAKQCRSVPASVLLYAFFIWLIVAHAAIPQAYETEESLYALLVTGSSAGFAVGSIPEWYTWMTTDILPQLLYPNAEAPSRGQFCGAALERLRTGQTAWPHTSQPHLPPTPPLAPRAGYVANYNLMVGGIRLVTTRGVETRCSGLDCACVRRRARGFSCRFLVAAVVVARAEKPRLPANASPPPSSQPLWPRCTACRAT